MNYEIQELAAVQSGDASLSVSGLYMELGEGPCWVKAADAMWFVNITGRELVTYSLSTRGVMRYPMPEMPGTVAPMADGRALVALESGMYAFDFGSRRLDRLWALTGGARFNDGKCSPEGRFFAGTMDHAERRNIGEFFRLDRDGSVARMFGDIGVSNGLCWSIDGRTMYYADTPTARIDAFDYDPATGELSNRRPVIDLRRDTELTGTRHGGPDGMTIDTRGRIWLAEWGGARVSVWDVNSGTQVDEIRFGCKCVSACTFGPGGVLYVTTAVRDDPVLAAGKVYTVQTDSEGLPAFEYAQ